MKLSQFTRRMALAVPLATLFSDISFAQVGESNGLGIYFPLATLNVTARPYIVTTADIDGDGDLDFLTPNFSTTAGVATSSVSVVRNDGAVCGNIVFTHLADVPVGSQPRGVAMGDLDGDGDQDMVTANYNDASYSARFNTGNGTFTGILNYTAGFQPQSVALTDLDGDGDLDVLCSNGADNNVTVGINNGLGAFTAGANVGVGPFPFSLVAVDIDGDGNRDLLTGDYYGNAVSIRFGSGNGTFAPPVQNVNVPVGNAPRGVATGDIDGDGDLDFVTANSNDNSVSVRRNTGNRTFNGTDFPVGSFPSSVALGDVNEDNALDLVVSNLSNNNVTVYLNNGTGTFTLHGTIPVGSQPNRAALADMDGDGDLDLLAANFGAATVSVQTNLNDLTVDITRTACGTYRNVTVTGTGNGTLNGNLRVVGNIVVQNGGTLHTACQLLNGPGTFTLAAGGTLGICDPAGISLTGATGAVRVTGTRTYASDASYTYNGTVAQVTGPALPSQVRNLQTNNTSAVTLTGNVTVMQKVTVGSTGNLVLNGKTLTLPSSAAGTALVVNSSTGVVQGSTALVQRYIDRSLNPNTSTNPTGLGYRHYSAPVSGSTVADLATPGTAPAGFTPVVNNTYNTSPTPGQVTPFPTVYGYDQSRLPTAAANTASFITNIQFDKGWFSPAALTSPLVVGSGYTVNIGGAEKVDFAGTLNNGNVTVSLARNSGTTAPDAGWALVGNPYPAPIDWSAIAAADRVNLEPSMHVFESTGRYTGRYRTYTNGMGTGSPLIGSSQGFFVRVSAGQTTGSLTFRNAHRLTDYAVQVPVRRGAADTRPMVKLQIQGQTGSTDELVAYAQTGASVNLDAQYDAAKLNNPGELSLAAITNDGSDVAINGLPAFDNGTEIALSVKVTSAGTFVFSAPEIRNLPASLEAFLVDLQTGQQTALSSGNSYFFETSMPKGGGPILKRFVLRFGSTLFNLNRAALGTSKDASAASVILYPNPAHSKLTVLLPPTVTAMPVPATLLNSLGQELRALQLATTGTPTTIDVSDLAKGVYLLRLQMGASTIVKRVVVQ